MTAAASRITADSTLRVTAVAAPTATTTTAAAAATAPARGSCAFTATTPSRGTPDLNYCPLISKSAFTRVRQCTYRVLVGTHSTSFPPPQKCCHTGIFHLLRTRKHDAWSDGVTSPCSNSRCTAGPLPPAEPRGFYMMAREVQALALAVAWGRGSLLGKEAELSHASSPDAKHCCPLVIVSSAYP